MTQLVIIKKKISNMNSNFTIDDILIRIVQDSKFREEFQKLLIEFLPKPITLEEQIRMIREITVPKKTSTKTYILKDDYSGLYKIGRSRNISSRLTILMCGNPSLTLLMFCHEDIENRLHHKYATKHVDKEWFSLTTEDLQEISLLFEQINKKK